MRKIFILIHLIVATSTFSQSAVIPVKAQNFAFQNGEWLKFRMSYSNFLNAGYSTIEVEEILHKDKAAFHITGIGKSTGLISLFFSVKDNYQSFLYKEW